MASETTSSIVSELVQLIPTWLLATISVSLVGGVVLCLVIATFRIRRIRYHDADITFDEVVSPALEPRKERVGSEAVESLEASASAEG
jgi:hypothetical protein